MLTKLKELKETAQEAEYEEESDDEVTPDDTIVSSYNTAKRIRMGLQNQRKAEKQALKAAREARSSSASGSQQMPGGETEYPSMQLEISYLEASRRVSCNLYNHLAWLITDAFPEVGDDGRVKVSPKQHEQVLNLAQDVCQTVAGIPTPKHIGTALHILKETRSKATVTLLNRFGNCISYQDAQRYITTMAKSVDEQTEPLDHLSILWHLVHICPTVFLEDLKPSCTAPTWSPFQAFLIPDATPATVISDGPFFPKSPMDPDVVEQSVQYCMDVSGKQGQEFTIITCDQAIYEVVLGLQKKNPQKYAKLILRMGGFHIAEHFLKAIGHLMQASGIEDIMVEADVCLHGTANKIISGKDYYAMLRAHTMVHAAMFALHWEAFTRWLIIEEKDLECISVLAING
ncbi:hypothetical protein AAFF_G00284860 [Aldrovandia affinis]|uniref:Uncharacterized protein n=1 Tax=Aldrovandia affinis TaxID=143900 RepID=A0AAD7TA92_9TELE|nr:hypothetical protein AAFF_G00284860 [Aldrovandia affinis]